MMRVQFGLFLLLFLGYSSCTEPIDIDLPTGESQIVAISNYSPDDSIRVFISEQRPLSVDSTNYLTNASVRIFLNGNERGTMRLVRPDGRYPNVPYYISNFLPKEERTYSLEIEVADNPIIKAVSMVPEAVPIQSISIDSVVSSRPTLDRRETLFSFYGAIIIQDPPAVKNYYHFAETIAPIDWFTIFQGDTILTTNQEYFLAPVFLLDNQDPAYLSLEQENGFLVDDATFDGQMKRIPFRASVAFDNDFRLVNRLNVLFRSVSADYFRYHSTYTRQLVAQESPFSEPVIVYNNIENGLGNFSGYVTAVDSISIGR